MSEQKLQWNGAKAPPRIGDPVKVFLNNLGSGTVTGYCQMDGYLGVIVELWNPPEWFIQQASNPKECWVVGCELDPQRPRTTT